MNELPTPDTGAVAQLHAQHDELVAALEEALRVISRMLDSVYVAMPVDHRTQCRVALRRGMGVLGALEQGGFR